MSLTKTSVASHLQQAQRLIETSLDPGTLFPEDLRVIAKKILLDLAGMISPPVPPTPEFVDEAILEPVFAAAAAAPAPHDEGSSTVSVGKTRKNFAKFVRELALPNEAEFFYGSAVFKLAGAGTSSPSLYTMIGKQRIVSHSPSGMINRYMMETTRRPVSASGWDRLTMLDMTDEPRPLSWEGWDRLLYSPAAQTFIERTCLDA